jgi:hypothetical protein
MIDNKSAAKENRALDLMTARVDGKEILLTSRIDLQCHKRAGVRSLKKTSDTRSFFTLRLRTVM